MNSNEVSWNKCEGLLGSVYVTVNMCNQIIRVFPEIFSEYMYSLKSPGSMCISFFLNQLLHKFTEYIVRI